MIRITPSIGKANYLFAVLYAVLVFLVIPTENKNMCLIPMMLIVVVNLLYMVFKHIRLDSILLCILVLLVTSLILDFTSVYSQDYVVRGWISLLMMYLMYINGVENVSRNLDNAIWLIVLALLIYNIFTADKMNDGSLIFHTAFYDRIETELMIIVFMFFGLKNRHYTGMIYTIWYMMTISTSRGSDMMLLLFFIIRYFKRLFINLVNLTIEYFKKPTRLFAFIACGLGVFIVFCYIWIYRIGVQDIGIHGTRLNDTSNFSRFSSTIYSIRELFGKYNLLFRGFGSDLTEVMGNRTRRVVYMGQTLVQSHNSFLSILLCYGIIPGILYIGILAKIIRSYFNYTNFEYIIPFLVYSFIIVIFGKRGYDFFWIFVLMIPQNDYKYKEFKEIKNTDIMHVGANISES